MADRSNSKQLKPLFRKVNTRARGVHHNVGGEYRYGRNSAQPDNTKMSQGKRRGLDYTPLYKYLIKSVGRDWNEIYSEVLTRVAERDAIFHIVAKSETEAEPYVRVGESSYYSGLYIDSNGVLQMTAPEVNEASLAPSCVCCTHTFNGVPFEQSYST